MAALPLMFNNQHNVCWQKCFVAPRVCGHAWSVRNLLQRNGKRRQIWVSKEKGQYSSSLVDTVLALLLQFIAQLWGLSITVAGYRLLREPVGRLSITVPGGFSLVDYRFPRLVTIRLRILKTRHRYRGIGELGGCQ